MKELKKSIKILKTHREVYQNTLNTLSQLKKKRKRDENTRSSNGGGKSRIV